MGTRFAHGLCLGCALLLGAAWPVLAETVRPAAAGSQLQQNTLSGVEQEHFLQEIQRHYPRRTPQQALLAHCNHLLESNALRAGYLDTRLGSRVAEDQVYSLGVVNPGELTVRLDSRSEDGRRMQISARRVALYGVDPFVRYRCPPGGPSCTVLNPFDGSDLLVMVRDRKAVAELAQTLSFLIRDLQKD